MSTIEYLGQQVEITKDGFGTRSPEAQEADWFKSTEELPHDDKTWSAIYNLIHRSWFERLWVMQEAQLANPKTTVVHCGRNIVNWSLYRRGLHCLSQKRTVGTGDAQSEKPKQRLALVRDVTRLQKSIGLAVLLFMSSRRLCADPRDKMYGLLGLASQDVRDDIRPEYGLSVVALYTKVFRIHAEWNNSLALLPQCNPKLRQITSLPTWIPDWSAPIGLVAMTQGGFVTGTSKADAAFVHEEKILRVRGVKIGVVRTAKGPAPLNVEDALDRIAEWAPENIEAGMYPSNESLLDAYSLSLCLNRATTRLSRGATSTLPAWKAGVMQLISHPNDAATRQSVARLPEFCLCFGYNFITTDEGYFGIGTPSIEAGDIVTAILGCLAPIVLRAVPSPFSGTVYHVIGSCYMHGFSDAEALLGPMPMPFETGIRTNSKGVWSRQFRNRDTSDVVYQDPRLGPLPTGWELIETGKEIHQQFNAPMFQKKDDDRSEMTEWDPRMTPESLTARGVPVEEFHLA